MILTNKLFVANSLKAKRAIYDDHTPIVYDDFTSKKDQEFWHEFDSKFRGHTYLSDDHAEILLREYYQIFDRVCDESSNNSLNL